MAYHFFSRVPKYTTCSCIPTRDDSLQVLTHDGIIRGFHYRDEQLMRM